MRQVAKALLALAVVLALTALACGSSDEATVAAPTQAPVVPSAGEATEPPGAEPAQPEPTETAPPPTPTPPEAYGVGSVIDMGDHTIVLNSAEISQDILTANLTVQNTGNDNVAISSLLSFDAKALDGTRLDQEIFDCGPGLDGSVLPGDVLRGSICWDTAGNASAKVYYTPGFLSSRTVIWLVGEGAPEPVATQPAEAAPAPAVEVHGIGEEIELEDHTAVLYSAAINQNILSANFIIQNGSAENISISSMLSFEAKAPDGTKLEQEIFDCGPGLDGTVLAGDRLRGNICWKAPGIASAKIYYTPEFLSSRTVVWAVGEGAPEAQPVPDLPVELVPIEGLQVYGLGEVIELEDHTIVLNSAELNQALVTANWSIQNTGGEDLTVSSMLSFEARGPDGTKLEQEIFDCPAGLDGTVLAGDNLRGSICWTAPDIQGVRIYYTPKFLSTRTVVWEVSRQ